MAKKISNTVNTNLTSKGSYLNACKGKQDATSAPASYAETVSNSWNKDKNK